MQIKSKTAEDRSMTEPTLRPHRKEKLWRKETNNRITNIYFLFAIDNSDITIHCSQSSLQQHRPSCLIASSTTTAGNCHCRVTSAVCLHVCGCPTSELCRKCVWLNQFKRVQARRSTREWWRRMSGRNGGRLDGHVEQEKKRASMLTKW